MENQGEDMVTSSEQQNKCGKRREFSRKQPPHEQKVAMARAGEGPSEACLKRKGRVAHQNLPGSQAPPHPFPNLLLL